MITIHKIRDKGKPHPHDTRGQKLLSELRIKQTTAELIREKKNTEQ